MSDRSTTPTAPTSAPAAAATPASATAAKPRVRLSSAWREANALFVANRWRLRLGLVLLLINRAASFVLPWSSKQLIDTVIPQRSMHLLIWLVVGVLIATLVDALSSFALARMLGIAAQKAINDLRKSIFSHVLRLPVSAYDATQSGILISRIMTDPEGVRNLIGTGIVQLIGGLITGIVAIELLFYMNWQLTCGILVLLALFGAVLGGAFRTLRPVFRQRGKISAQVTGRLNETLGGIRIIKAYAAEDRERTQFAGGVDSLFDSIRTTMSGISAISALSTVVIGLVGILVMIVAGRSIIHGQMTPGDLFFYVGVTAMVAMPVFQIASIGTQITEAFAGLDRLRELRAQTTEDAEDPQRQEAPRLRGEVAFEGVFFAYAPGRPVLKDINLVAKEGTTTALVGSSGSGKSTLVSLVMAFNRPYAGTVRVDGTDLSTLTLRSYRQHLGVVMQDNFLFDGTIGENIAFARPQAARADIEAAAKIAYCDEFIRDFPQGYDTIVGERGIKLSGGQRQRVAIARALLADPRILILDEATSSLDSESESKIQAGLQTLRSGRTTFVIAHRLSTIRSADQILVLEGGCIVERGTHEQLMALQGRYRDLHDRQYQAERERFVNPGEELKAPARAGLPATGSGPAPVPAGAR